MKTHIPAKFKKECQDEHRYITVTPTNIKKMAEELMRYLIDKNLDSEVRIFYKQKRKWITIQPEPIYTMTSDWIQVKNIHRNKEYVWHETDALNPNDYFEYNGEILSMSFEGPLYDELNYAFETGSYNTETELRNFFSHWGLYYELGNAWNLSLYEI